MLYVVTHDNVTVYISWVNIAFTCLYVHLSTYINAYNFSGNSRLSLLKTKRTVPRSWPLVRLGSVPAATFVYHQINCLLKSLISNLYDKGCTEPLINNLASTFSWSSKTDINVSFNLPRYNISSNVTVARPFFRFSVVMNKGCQNTQFGSNKFGQWSGPECVTDWNCQR